MTVQANLEGSSNTAGSRAPRGIQRIQGANPALPFQPTITRATSSISSRSSGTRTPLKRVDLIPLQELSTPDAPQLHGAKNIENQNSENSAEPAPTHINAPLTSTTGIQKYGESLVASSGVKKVRPQKKIDVPKKS